MKALSLWQPYASLVALGVKRIETRSWQTSYRGPLAIHAAQRRCGAEAYDEPLYRPGDLGNPATLPLGVVVATCTLVDCLPMVEDKELAPAGDGTVDPPPCLLLDGLDNKLWLYDGGVGAYDVEDQRPYGDFRPGRFAWVFDTDIKPIDPPVPARGRQQLWEWTP